MVVAPLRPEAERPRDLLQNGGVQGLAGKPLFTARPWTAFSGPVVEQPPAPLSWRIQVLTILYHIYMYLIDIIIIIIILSLYVTVALETSELWAAGGSGGRPQTLISSYLLLSLGTVCHFFVLLSVNSSCPSSVFLLPPVCRVTCARCLLVCQHLPSVNRTRTVTWRGA